MNTIPVYNIIEFNGESHAFYSNRLADHLRKHHFIHAPHKHDFYLCVIFTQGTGNHEIDFINYKVLPGSVFFLKPGQMHNWHLSKDIDGFIFFHSKEFYDVQYQNRQINDFPFYSSIYNSPVIHTSLTGLKEVDILFELMMAEFGKEKSMKAEMLCSFADLIYIKLARLYSKEDKKNKNAGYLDKLMKLEKLIDVYYKDHRRPSEYADMLNITGKHLNRIVKDLLNKTVSEMVGDRIILEAKRMLVHSDYTVSQVADKLGFQDHSYFNRFFKKHTNQTPLLFSGKYRRNK